MTPKEFEALYLGKFETHPFELLSISELTRIEKDKFSNRDDRRLARKIRIEMEDRLENDQTK